MDAEAKVPLILPDGRSYEIGVSPMNCGVSLQQLASPRLTVADDTLVLTASPFQRHFGASITACGVAWLIVAAVAHQQGWRLLTLIGAGDGLAMFLIGLFFFLSARTIVFDRRSGLVRITSGVRSEEHPLKQIIALQAIFGGWHASGDEKVRVPSYQLNSVLDAGIVRRVALVSLSSKEAIAELASSIATFLGVPAMHHLDHLEAARSP